MCCRQKKIKAKEHKILKTRECITCKHFLICNGKENDKPCVKYEARNKENKEKKQERMAYEVIGTD